MAQKKPTKIPTIVICDDDRMSRQIFRAVAERCGYQVIAGIDTAMEALQLVTRYKPDVLLLDLVLPNMSGEEIVAPIRTVAPDCAIVICSSYDAGAAVRNGALYVVPKGSLDRLEWTLDMLKQAPAATAV